jgi:hypothetical protein
MREFPQGGHNFVHLSNVASDLAEQSAMQSWWVRVRSSPVARVKVSSRVVKWAVKEAMVAARSESLVASSLMALTPAGRSGRLG